MFTKLMKELSYVYQGDTIYVPEKLKVFIEPWLLNKGAKRSQFQRKGFQSGVSMDGDSFRWDNKTVTFFCEDALVRAYKKMPVPHIPEKITEEEYIIEFNMDSPEAQAVAGSSKPWQVNTARKLDDEEEEKPKKKGGISW